MRKCLKKLTELHNNISCLKNTSNNTHSAITDFIYSGLMILIAAKQ